MQEQEEALVDAIARIEHASLCESGNSTIIDHELKLHKKKRRENKKQSRWLLFILPWIHNPTRCLIQTDKQSHSVYSCSAFLVYVSTFCVFLESEVLFSVVNTTNDVRALLIVILLFSFLSTFEADREHQFSHRRSMGPTEMEKTEV